MPTEKYGFVYLWYDRKHKRFYIGSHWGTEDDGYVCSSSWMKTAYKVRSQDFKRRILKRVVTNRMELLAEEAKFINRIKPHEIKKRYYNLCTGSTMHWSAGSNAAAIAKKSGDKRRGQVLGPPTDETRRKISEAKKGRTFSPEHCEKLRQAKLGKKLSAEHRSNIAANHKTKH